ncbi:hypothetical protein FACS189413_14510 [Bacteroidia bacterium]|nr:hypothetical protein FACS189413_14510 [Bacteroidia bacterium]
MVVSTGFVVLTPTFPNLCSELIYFFVINDVNLQNLQAIAEMSVSTYPSITEDDGG